MLAGARAMAQAGVSSVLRSARVLACTCQQHYFLGTFSHTLAEQQPPHRQQQQRQQQLLYLPLQPLQQQHAGPHRTFSSSSGSSAFAADDAPAAAVAEAPSSAMEQPGSSSSKAAVLPDSAEMGRLLQVLLQPMPRSPSWNAQLSPYLMQVNDQLLVQPQAVLLSMVRALHVIRGVLQEDGHVYVVGTNKLLAPLVKAAAASCLNPNMWFSCAAWSPGSLTNYASSKRLFKEAHQPNRRLLAAKGYRMVNPLCPEPPLSSAPVPRLSWDDKWLLHKRSRRPGYRLLLQQLLQQEDSLHKFKPAGSLRGMPRHLRLMVFLDTTRNAVAIKEAYNRNIPTVAMVNTTKDLSLITYPVLARDFSPNFAHFFLDWVVKVANAAPGDAPEQRQQLLHEAQGS